LDAPVFVRLAMPASASLISGALHQDCTLSINL
jgi:hypothetical protein